LSASVAAVLNRIAVQRVTPDIVGALLAWPIIGQPGREDKARAGAMNAQSYGIVGRIVIPVTARCFEKRTSSWSLTAESNEGCHAEDSACDTGFRRPVRCSSEVAAAAE
jgi:hypothetical protein